MVACRCRKSRSKPTAPTTTSRSPVRFPRLVPPAVVHQLHRPVVRYAEKKGGAGVGAANVRTQSGLSAVHREIENTTTALRQSIIEPHRVALRTRQTTVTLSESALAQQKKQQEAHMIGTDNAAMPMAYGQLSSMFVGRDEYSGCYDHAARNARKAPVSICLHTSEDWPSDSEDSSDPETSIPRCAWCRELSAFQAHHPWGFENGHNTVLGFMQGIPAPEDLGDIQEEDLEAWSPLSLDTVDSASSEHCGSPPVSPVDSFSADTPPGALSGSSSRLASKPIGIPETWSISSSIHRQARETLCR